MSQNDNDFSRRDFVKAAGAAGITGLAGCNSRATNDDTPTPEQDPEQEDPVTDTPTPESTQNYDTQIKTGEEFDWFASGPHLSEEGAIDPESYGTEKGEDVLFYTPRGIVRHEAAQEFLTSEEQETINENYAPIAGPGFINAEFDELGTMVYEGLSELGALDLHMDKDEITNRLEDNGFTTASGPGNRDLYEGTFTDERRMGLEYDVLIGVEGSNMIWAADRPDNVPGFVGDLELAYDVLESTVGPGNPDDRDSAIETDSYEKQLLDAIQTEFTEHDHQLSFAPNQPDVENTHYANNPEEYSYVDAAVLRWNNEGLRHKDLDVLKDGQDFYIQEGDHSEFYMKGESEETANWPHFGAQYNLNN